MKKDITDNEYYEIKALSKSQLKLWDIRYPGRFWKNCTWNEQRELLEHTDAMALGQLCHCLFLEPEALKDKFVVSDEWGKSRKNKGYAEIRNENPHKLVVNTKEVEQATKMVSYLQKDPHIQLYINGAKTEKPFLWTEPTYKMPMKAKLDAIRNTPEGIVVIDYKTTGQMDAVLRNPETMGLMLEVGTYAQCVKQKYGKDMHKFLYIFQSTKEGEQDRIAVRYFDEETIPHCKKKLDYTLYEVKSFIEKIEAGENPPMSNTAEEFFYIPPFALNFLEDQK